jgi:predicted DNA-binding transcriptional regulator AlpA
MSIEVKTARGRRLYRRRTSMELLDCSLSMLKRLENEGTLKKVRLGSRDVFHLADEVDALATAKD